MEFSDFVTIWDKLMAAPEVHRVILNSTGDMNQLRDKMDYYRYIENHHAKPVIMTTNGLGLDYVPKIEELVISFNGGDKESYEYTTDLPFDEIVATIRAAYPQLEQLPRVEMHCLVWEKTEGIERQFKELWHDFPGRLRISYKVENQFGTTIKPIEPFRDPRRIYCEYLNWLVIAPTGKVISCAHDFAFQTNLGDLLTESVAEVLQNPGRLALQSAHRRGVYPGLCEKCNFNVTNDGKIFYLK